MKQQILTKRGLSFVLICLLWVPFASPWHHVPVAGGIYCALILIGWTWLRNSWKGWKNIPDSPSEADGWWPLLGYAILVGMLLDLYRVPTPRGVGNFLLTVVLALVTVLALRLESPIENFYACNKRLGQGLLLIGVGVISLALIGCNLKGKDPRA